MSHQHGGIQVWSNSSYSPAHLMTAAQRRCISIHAEGDIISTSIAVTVLLLWNYNSYSCYWSHLWGQICRNGGHSEGEAGELVCVGVGHGDGEQRHRYIGWFILKTHIVPHRLCQVQDAFPSMTTKKAYLETIALMGVVFHPLTCQPRQWHRCWTPGC